MNLPEIAWTAITGAFFAAIIYTLVRPQSNAVAGVTAVSDALANIVKMSVA